MHFKQNLNDHNTYLVTQENSQYKYWHHKNQIQRQEAQIAEERPSFIRMVIEGMDDYNNVETLIIKKLFSILEQSNLAQNYIVYIGIKLLINGYKNGIRRQGVAGVFAIVGPILAATGTAFAGTFRNEIAAIASMS